MKKIGVLMGSMHCNKYLYKTIQTLAKSNQVELFFLINTSTKQQSTWEKIKFEIKTKGLIRFIAFITFKIWISLERKILGRVFPKVKQSGQTFDANEFKQNEYTLLHPIFSKSGLVVRYPAEDIERIRSLEIDLIIRGNSQGIIRGDILKISKEGVISFHHGDNRWNRGGPPAFWEVYFRKPSTGFIIQILTAELDGGDVIFRGNIPTCRSYTENLVSLYNESTPYMANIILQYAATDKLLQAKEKTPYSGTLLVLPTFTQSISYLIRTTFLYTTIAFNRLILRKREKWGIAFTKGSWRDAIMRKGTRIKNPKNHFFADPFIITKNNRTICFVEDYDYKKKKGHITAIEILDKKNYKVLGAIIEEDYHMSFPYIFECEEELYMIPETIQSDSIRLYKCTEFPLKWAYQKDILSNVSAVDSMLFKFGQKWWLLSNMAENKTGNHCSQLMAYYSNHPLSDQWTAHAANPLVFDSKIARNGGILNVKSNTPIRVRQKQGFDDYGVGMTLAVINELTASSYNEEQITEITPDFFPKIRACHHIHSNDEYTVYDYFPAQ